MRLRAIVTVLAAASSIVVFGAATRSAQVKSKPSRYVYIWAGTGTHSGGKMTHGANMIAVIDVDPSSPKYGTVINAVTVDDMGGAVEGAHDLRVDPDVGS